MLYVEVDLVLGKVKPLSPLPRPTRVEMKGGRGNATAQALMANHIPGFLSLSQMASSS